jgi:D-3-phosphoglycerate dehydrogenase
MGEARIESLSVRYYGELATGQHPLIANAALVGLFEAILSHNVTEVNARAVASARGIDLFESSSTRSRVYRSLVSLQLKTSAGMRWLEGTTAPTGSRLVLLDGVPLEAPLTGTTLLFENNDQPGVVGTLGTVLARHGINIAKFSLGRTETGNAVGAVQLDEPAPIPKEILSEIRALKQLKAAWLVRV